jgi:hypothetical protein
MSSRLRPLFQPLRAAAALALPLKGVAGFAREPGCFRVPASAPASRRAIRQKVGP